MANYDVSNAGYPGAYASQLTFPVVEDSDPAIAVDAGLRGPLQIGTVFPASLDEAIQSADRHVFVFGRPPNPVKFVEDWINILRWEVSNLWSLLGGNAYDRNRTVQRTREHYKRSGEALAEGLAILFR